MKNEWTSSDKAAGVRRMFSRIAPRYDLMNRLMTAGQDVRWRKEIIRLARLQPGARVLDLGAGTGDIAREALRQQPECRLAVAADFTLDMMLAGKPRNLRGLVWCAADALNLPYANETFDAVVSGFLLRNVADLPRAIAEQYRVLKPGGRWVALDTTPPPQKSLLTPFIRFHMRQIIPLLGQIITGERDAYVYLPTSSENFLSAEALVQLVEAAGFQQVTFCRYLFGVVAIHQAVKPA
ncbi:MAG: ubiquinone/menaquinone biosynthesis methyltransferase [Chloroflexota bacterium]